MAAFYTREIVSFCFPIQIESVLSHFLELGVILRTESRQIIPLFLLKDEKAENLVSPGQSVVVENNIALIDVTL